MTTFPNQPAAQRSRDCLGFAWLPYHRNKAARRMRDGWSRRDISLSEYGWLRGLDKSPRRPLVSLVAAESRIRA